MAPATREHNPILQESRDVPVNHRGRTLGAEGKPYQGSRCACHLYPKALTVEVAGIEAANGGSALPPDQSHTPVFPLKMERPSVRASSGASVRFGPFLVPLGHSPGGSGGPSSPRAIY